MWGRLSDGIQRFQDTLDSVIDQTFKEVPHEGEGRQDGDKQSDDAQRDVANHTQTSHSSPSVDKSEYERLRQALDEAQHQNQHINKEFQQLLRDKEVARV